MKSPCGWMQPLPVGALTVLLVSSLLTGCARDTTAPVAKSPSPGPTLTPEPAPPTASPTIDTTQPFWYVPFLEAEAELDRLDGTVAGVRIGSGLDYGPLGCSVARWEYDVAAAAGTPLDVDIREEVEGSTTYQEALVGLCADGSVAIAEADFGVTDGSPVSPFGGNVRMFRHTGAAVASLAIPAIRWSEMDVAGAPAAVAAPILSDIGLGQGAIVTYRDGVLTLIHTTGISLDGLLSIGADVLQD